MRKPKKIKSPKKPKANASIATMENYLKKVKDVAKRNADNERDYKKAQSLKEKIRRM
jgi:C4-type Zn-finger protein